MDSTKTVLIGLALVLAVSFAFAAKPTTEQPTAPGAPAGAPANEAKNMTFGQCVSDAADVKNTCYDTVKTTYSACQESARNQTDKSAQKSCSQQYKKDKTQCKADFKAAKKECGKLKHNAWDSFKAAFK